jgi:hypothetical protein
MEVENTLAYHTATITDVYKGQSVNVRRLFIFATNVDTK